MKKQDTTETWQLQMHCNLKVTRRRSSRSGLFWLNLYSHAKKMLFPASDQNSDIIIIIIITGQGDLRLAPTSPVQAKIQ